jgi:hypothetical protein
MAQENPQGDRSGRADILNESMPISKNPKQQIKPVLIICIIAVAFTIGLVSFLKTVYAPANQVSTNQQLQAHQEAEQITLDDLKNADYYFPSRNETVTLKNGKGVLKVTQSALQGREYPVYLDMTKYAFGDLNNDGRQDAVIFLTQVYSSNPNYPPTYSLYVMLNKAGKPVYAASEYMPSAIPQSLTIESGQIHLDLFVAKPGKDVLTLRSFVFKLADGNLTEMVNRQVTELEKAVQPLLSSTAKIVDVQELSEMDHAHRALVLWMINPTQHFKLDYVNTCPEQGQGSTYVGPTRISLVDTENMQIVNTVELGYGGQDSMSISYRNSTDNWYPYYFPFQNLSEAKKTIDFAPKLLNLQDYTGDGKALEFAILTPPLGCVGFSHVLAGYSEKQDKAVEYKIPKYLLVKKPETPGYWKYSVDHRGRGGCLENYDVQYDQQEESFKTTYTEDCSS